ncbi:hypothetical protein ACFWUQ_18095 [Streptomyces sp. NPDC058662]|uniref:LppU/SCO3897 family protein n=1 Tax=Streptomyces sp. NPDC058662 TaxID=3346583 RepID=UPI00365D8D38
MSAQEMDLTLTPHQAAYGVILPVDLPTGPARVRIPSCRDGELVRTRVGDREILLRIRVAEPAPATAPAPPQPPPTLASQPVFPPPSTTTTPAPAPAPRRGAAGCLVGLGLVAALIIGAVLIGSGDDTGGKASSSSASSPAGSPSTPAYSPSYTPASSPSAAPADPAPAPAPPTPTAAAPTPLDKGTCLNGTLPDSTTAQRVDDVEEVSCSASDAHYRVIESIPMTSDMSRCDDNPRTEYAFSHRYTLNGAVINEYVYCLVGIGSYAR